jgi:hypothetical protein
MQRKLLIPLCSLALLASPAVPAAAQGGSTTPKTLPQVGGAWNGQEHYDPTLAVFFPTAALMNPPLSITLSEDAAGNLTGTDGTMIFSVTGLVPMTGKASANGTIVVQETAYYGQKLTGSLTGSVTCSDGSIGQVFSGKFQRKEGFGTFSADNCPTR